MKRIAFRDSASWLRLNFFPIERSERSSKRWSRSRHRRERFTAFPCRL